MRKKTYCIRASVLYAGVAVMVLLALLAYYRNDLYELWKEKNGMEKVVYEDMKSELSDESCCYLCGSSNKSLVGYYRKTSSLGIISLNNWYVTDFRIEESEEGMDSGASSALTSIDGISIYSEGTPARGTASIEVDLSEDCQVDYEMLEKNLCQSCLDKIMSALEYRKWKVEDKNPVPLCLIDFETLDIYSLQDTLHKYSVRDYWVVASCEKNRVLVDAYNLPYR